MIPIKLEFSASVGLIHKESVMMHVRTIVKKFVLTVNVCFVQAVVERSLFYIKRALILLL